MRDVRPKLNRIDLSRLRLSPEEGFVLSRVDGATTVGEIVSITGFDEGRVHEIVARLASEGAIEVEGIGHGRGEIENEIPVLGSEHEVHDEDPGDADEEALTEEEEAEGGRNELSYRQIYEREYHPLSRDQRLKAAQEMTGADLCALCFDAEPQVIHALLTNPHAGFEHARLIAVHHRTQAGLEAVAKRSEFLKDTLVQRRLLRNPQLPVTILQRMVSPKLLLDTYKIAIDREIPERSRVMTREILRKKFTLAGSDEKASLLVKTEGRCLLLLTNCSLDAHATQILCARSTYTILFVQNLARWSATPPPLLAHLVKLPTVRANQGMKKMLLKHPNMPSEAKRLA